MQTNKYVDYSTIHRFDPTIEHMGGAGDAGKWLGNPSVPTYDAAPGLASSTNTNAAVSGL